MKLLVTGGGTGGHIYPGIAIAKRVRVAIPDCEVLYVGNKYGPERKLVRHEGIRFESIHVKSFYQLPWYKYLGALILLFKGLWESHRIIKRFKPDLVIGTGGYVSGPVVWMAHLKGVEALIHEQNAVPGWTTEVLSRYASKVLISYKESIQYFKNHNKLYYTGNPVREEFQTLTKEQARDALNLPHDAFLVLVTGGSNGSSELNALGEALIQRLEQYPDLYVCLISGRRHYKQVKDNLLGAVNHPRARVLDYSQDVVELMVASDLSVCRAGAVLLAEMTAIALPGILVPAPDAANNHQFHNAQVFEKQGACLMLEEKALKNDPDLFLKLFEDLYRHRFKLKVMRENFADLCRENALNAIMSIIYPYHLR